MCYHTTIHNSVCYCTQTRYLICDEHVEHTRMQKDNYPCRYLDIRHVEVYDHPPACRGATSNSACLDRQDEVWTFEKWGKSWASRCFVEDYRRGWIKEDSYGRRLGCCSGEWMASDDHTCGLGKSFRGRFRHLNSYGQPIFQERREISDPSQEIGRLKRITRENASYTETGKMAEDMGKMEIDGDEIKIKPEPREDYSGMFSLKDKSVKVKVEPIEEEEEL